MQKSNIEHIQAFQQNFKGAWLQGNVCNILHNLSDVGQDRISNRFGRGAEMDQHLSDLFHNNISSLKTMPIGRDQSFHHLQSCSQSIEQLFELTAVAKIIIQSAKELLDNSRQYV
jgi:hypothetical protein